MERLVEVNPLYRGQSWRSKFDDRPFTEERVRTSSQNWVFHPGEDMLRNIPGTADPQVEVPPVVTVREETLEKQLQQGLSVYPDSRGRVEKRKGLLVLAPTTMEQ